MHSKVPSDWLSSYIKTTQLFLEMFKMAGYFPDVPRKISVYAGKGVVAALRNVKSGHFRSVFT